VRLEPFALTEPVPPEPDGLVADVDATLMEQVFDVSRRKRKAHAKHQRQADDLGACFEVPKRGAFGHPAKLRNRPPRLKQISSDNAQPRTR
jgi:hypothetical protein